MTVDEATGAAAALAGSRPEAAPRLGGSPLGSPSLVVPTLTNEDLLSLKRIMLDHTAIQLDLRQSYLLDARLRPVAQRYHLPGLSELIRALLPANPQLVTDTLDALTTNDTAFFLTSELVETLVEHVVPDLMARRRGSEPLTIWSAACSSGQEAYSLAILLLERYPRLAADGQIRILASDVSPTMVRRCAAGRFSSIEVRRGLPSEILARQFELDGRDWVARAELRAMVSARVMNLIQPWPGVPRCDLVLARNVLGYFPDQVRHLILDRIRRTALQPHGYLQLSPDELTLGASSGFLPAEPVGNGTYRIAEAQ
jgi:chemotaxis protein methyltransferase CheR